MTKKLGWSLAFALSVFPRLIWAADLLFISDSHGEGVLGQTLVDELEDHSLEVAAYAVGGSTPREWLEGLPQPWGYWEHHTGQPDIRSEKPITPQVSKLLQKHRPQAVVVSLGTNFLWKEFGPEERKQIRSLAVEIVRTTSRCLWVGPPGLRLEGFVYPARYLAIQQGLKEELAGTPCLLLKSWEKVSYPAQGGDGIHYDAAGSEGSRRGQAWGRWVGQEAIGQFYWY